MAVKAIVAGGGIGGLTATLALREAGCEVVVLERATLEGKRRHLLYGGAGLTIWPNGTSVLSRYGVMERLPKIDVGLTSVTFRAQGGKVIYRDDFSGFLRRYGHPAMPLHRADLVQGLIDAVGPETIQFDKEVSGFRQDLDKVVLTTADGSEYDGDILIGAEGIASPVRAGLLKDGEPTWSHLTGWRGVAPGMPRGIAPGDGGNSWGRGEEFGWMPMVDGRVYWYGATNKLPLMPLDAPREPQRWKQQALDFWGGWHAPVRELIDTSDPESIHVGAMFYRPPVDRWGEGRVTLLGDAAHAMEPHLAQGASQAMEDALVLADAIRTAPDPVSGLRQYERLRLERANWFVATSQKMGKTIHMTNPVLCGIRNRVMSVFFKRTATKRHDQIIRGPAITKKEN